MVAEALQNDSDMGRCLFRGTADNVDWILNAMRGMYTMKCQNCGSQTDNPRFCSRSCAAQYNNRLHPKRQKRRYYCAGCGTEVAYKRKYCKNCYPFGLKDYLGVTIAEIQSKAPFQANARIRQLARRVYRDSDKPKQCSVCGYSKHFEICHIKAIKDWPTDTPIAVINSLNNLVALCPNCHWEFDHGLLTF
jgi:rRNA maturation protein Nop10